MLRSRRGVRSKCDSVDSRHRPANVDQRVRGRALAVGSLATGCILALGCSAAVAPETGTSQQPILDGYVDDATSGVVGLAVSLGRNIFAGHCSGALIAPNLVLTARHCVTEIGWDDPGGVVCGESDFNATREANELWVSPRTERPNTPDDPSYVRGRRVFVAPGGRDLCGFDVALIELERTFDAAEATPLVPRVDLEARAREQFSAAGYGLTGVSPASPSGVRMRTDERSVVCTGESCNAFATAPVLMEREWLSDDANVCQGDSGGPALDDEGRVIGVASRGPASCDAAVYGDVAAWGDFIIDVALQAAETGGYDPPFWTDGTSELPASELAVDSASLDEVEMIELAPELDEDTAPECAGSCEGDQPSALEAESACSVSGIGAQRGGTLSAVLLLAFGVMYRRRRR